MAQDRVPSKPTGRHPILPRVVFLDPRPYSRMNPAFMSVLEAFSNETGQGGCQQPHAAMPAAATLLPATQSSTSPKNCVALNKQDSRSNQTLTEYPKLKPKHREH